jgi:hypothetical protein
MALPIEEVLRVWRELERLEVELPDDAPERRVISAEIVQMKRLYRSLVDNREATAERLRSSRDTLDQAQALIRDARGRLQPIVTAEEVATVWRRLDDEFRTVPRDDPARHSLEASIADLQLLYHLLLTPATAPAAAKLSASRRAVELARDRLSDVERRRDVARVDAGVRQPR